MAIFPHDHPFAIALHDQDHPADEPARVGIAVDPARIVPQAPYALDDAILAVLGVGHTPTSPTWNLPALSDWAPGTTAPRPLNHPTARFHPGGLAHACPSLKKGQHPVLPAVLHAQHLTVGTHTFPRRWFSAPPYRHAHARIGALSLQQDALSPVFYALALGTSKGMLALHSASGQPLPATHHAAMIQAVLARAAMLLDKAHGPVGSAKRAGWETGVRIARTLHTAWLIRPVRVGDARALTASPELARMWDSLGAQPAFHAGTRLARLLEGVPTPRAYALAGMEVLKGLTHHAALAHQARIQAIDHTLLAALQAADLTPTAARQQAALLRDARCSLPPSTATPTP